MKKSAILIVLAAIIVSLCINLIPVVFSQPENVDILSYSWYMNPSGIEEMIVVGEAQNVGPNVIDYVLVKGTFYTPDGEPYIESYGTTRLTTNILPQQKTPFYIRFNPSDIIGGSEWTSQDATNFTATVVLANPTEVRQYQDLEVISHSASDDSEGYYRVTGVVQNTGNEATNRTWVLATFYNSTGSAIAIGFSNFLTPTSISPGGTATFTLYPHDYSNSVVDAISSYSLIIQTEVTEPPETPTPSPSTTASPTPTGTSSPTPTPTEPGNGATLSNEYIYLAVVAVIIVIVVVAFVFWKRPVKTPQLPNRLNTQQIYPMQKD